MTLSYGIAENLNEILTRVEARTETRHDRQVLVKMLNAFAPDEVEIFIKRHNIASIAALKRHLGERDSGELLAGLAILGAALLTTYLLSRPPRKRLRA